MPSSPSLDTPDWAIPLALNDPERGAEGAVYRQIPLSFLRTPLKGGGGGTLSREPYICHHPPSFGHIYVAFLYKIKGLVRGKHRGGEGGEGGEGGGERGGGRTVF
jgi:hypothetical protein